MKKFVLLISIPLVATLLTGFDGFWEDSIVKVGKTSVYSSAIGGDEHLMLVVHRIEADAMVSFVETYNQIAYNSNRPRTEICKELEKTGIDALKQREKTFASQYEVKCLPNADDVAPTLNMFIWPQVRYSYRFIITFKPTP